MRSRLTRLFFLGFTLFCLIGVHAPTKAFESIVWWQDSFDEIGSLDSWEMASSYHYHDAELPCLGVDHQPAQWQWQNGQVGVQIADAFPCKTVLVPRNLPPLLIPYAMAVDIKINNPVADRNVILYWLDQNNYLGLHIFDQFVQFEEKINGVSQTIVSGSRWYGFKMNTTYHLSLSHNPSTGHLRLVINDALVINGSEQFPRFPHPLVGGRPGLAASVGSIIQSETWFDNFKIINLPPGLQLEVSEMTQLDDRWRRDEYDSAHDWHPTDPSIGRWGCALASAAMVFRYHQLTHVPNNPETVAELTPGSLNSWLQRQTDGYLDNGGINWRALARLSYWHEQQYGTPALEFSYFSQSSNPIAWLQHEIEAGRPTILEEPKHFIVTTRVGPDPDEIGIIDPYFPDRRTLHDYQQSYLSARVFTPSHTDLGALVVISPKLLDISAYDAKNTLVQPDSWWEPAPSDPLTQQSPLPPLLVYSWPQDKANDLSVIIKAEPFTVPVTLWRYDRIGNLIKNEKLLIPQQMDDINLATASTSLAIFSASSPVDETHVESPITTQPWTIEELAWWWQWQRLPFPQFIPFVYQGEANLVASTSVENAQIQSQHWLADLQRWFNQTNTLPDMQNLLTTHYQRVLLTRWP